jgi:hypothetical protein
MNWRFVVPLALLILGGCAGLPTGKLSGALLDQDDPETVEAGMPAFLLLVDTLIRNDPDDDDLLFAGAKLYSAYAGVLAKDPERARRLNARARDYAERGMCVYRKSFCKLSQRSFDEFRAALADVRRSHLPALYAYTTTWAGWIQANSQDWNAIADLARVRAAMERVVELDDQYEHGGAHFYLGIMNTLLPPALGGKPETGRLHFERAIALSQDRDLVVKVEYARRYARLTFDRALHDRLLKEVIEAPAAAPGYTLSNTLAQRAAHELLKSADSYF